jgi:hypothetical protein
MTRGSLFGYEVVSELPLRRLGDGPAPRGPLALRLAAEPVKAGRGPEVHRAERAGTTFVLERVGSALAARCSATGSYLIDPGARAVWAHPAGQRDDAWEHRVVSVAFPLLAAELGDAVLHASAIARDGRAIAFAGPPGRGKSSIAAAAPRFELLGEDGVAVSDGDGGPLVWPGPRGVRLHDGSGKATRLVAELVPARGPVPLGAIVLLGEREPERLRLDPIAPADAVPRLVPALIFGGSDRLAAAFSGAAQLAATTPVYAARFPEGLERLDAALEDVVRQVL